MPWRIGGNRVSMDPTPRQPLLLFQMLEWEEPSLYLGRPCYFGLGSSDVCDANVWTFSRYSEEVVGAMLEATEEWLSTIPHIESVTLVGHSGGGVLALLIAERITVVDQVSVVALATPVSTERWTDLHGFLKLDGSLDPMVAGKWQAGVERLFVFGEHDQNVPPRLFVPLAENIPGSRVFVVKGEGHRCCSPDIWAKKQKKPDISR